MENRTASPEPVDLVTIGRNIVGQYQTADFESEVTLTCPDELSICSYPAIIRKILSELADNAISHNTRSTPCVEITVRSGDDNTAEIVVTDNGPGIPQFEVEVLADGSETPLEHSRGLGLWFVNWAVTRLGGSVSFEASTTGTAVVVKIPDLRMSGTDSESGPIGRMGTDVDD
jgi:Signal transduction histidine kinase